MRFRRSERTTAVAMRHGRVRSRIPEPLERFTFAKSKTRGGAQRRPARTKRKNSAFSAKRQVVFFEIRSSSN